MNFCPLYTTFCCSFFIPRIIPLQICFLIVSLCHAINYTACCFINHTMMTTFYFCKYNNVYNIVLLSFTIIFLTL